MTEAVDQGLAASSVGNFLRDLASAAPTPGGGGAAALTGAIAAALVAMVANLTIGRPRFAAVEEEMKAILLEIEQIRGELLRLADEDARAYAGVAAALRLPRSTDDERQARAAAIQQALRQAVLPPLDVLEVSRSLLPLCLQVAARGNSNVASDAGVAGELAAAATRASMFNIRVNLTDLKDVELIGRCEARIAAAETGLTDDVDRLTALVRAKTAPKATA